MTAEGHRDCPGHAGFISLIHGYHDTTTGQPIAEDDALINVIHDDEDEDLDQHDTGDGDGGDVELMDAADRPAAAWGSYLAIRTPAPPSPPTATATATRAADPRVREHLACRSYRRLLAMSSA